MRIKDKVKQACKHSAGIFSTVYVADSLFRMFMANFTGNFSIQMEGLGYNVHRIVADAIGAESIYQSLYSNPVFHDVAGPIMVAPFVGMFFGLTAVSACYAGSLIKSYDRIKSKLTRQYLKTTDIHLWQKECSSW